MEKYWQIAKEYGYDNPDGKCAPKLTDGDIKYWMERNLPESEIRRQFEARGVVISLAEKHKYPLPTPGDLSYWAERLLAGDRTREGIETEFKAKNGCKP